MEKSLEAIPVTLPWKLAPSGAGIQFTMREECDENGQSSSFTALVFVQPSVLRRRGSVGYESPRAFGCELREIHVPGKLRQVITRPYAIVEVFFDWDLGLRVTRGDETAAFGSAGPFASCSTLGLLRAQLGDTEATHRVFERWVSTGETDSGVFVVKDSPWPSEFAKTSPSAEPAGLKHFLIVSHDVYIELLARGFTWNVVEERE